jgi:hypothetical protein
VRRILSVSSRSAILLVHSTCPADPHHYGLKTLRDGESLRAWSRYGPSQLQAMRA